MIRVTEGGGGEGNGVGVEEREWDRGEDAERRGKGELPSCILA